MYIYTSYPRGVTIFNKNKHPVKHVIATTYGTSLIMGSHIGGYSINLTTALCTYEFKVYIIYCFTECNVLTLALMNLIYVSFYLIHNCDRNISHLLLQQMHLIVLDLPDPGINQSYLDYLDPKISFIYIFVILCFSECDVLVLPGAGIDDDRTLRLPLPLPALARGARLPPPQVRTFALLYQYLLFPIVIS